jgi:UDP-glucose 4-epimerase
MKPDDILLIGGNGFIGGALAKRLRASGRRLHVISPNLPTSTSLPPGCHRASMSDPQVLAEALPQCGTIVHAASATTPGSSARHPSREGLLNIVPSLALIEALDQLKRFHLIFISSGGTVYGDPDSLPAAETHPLRPKSYYAVGKIALEEFFRLASRPPAKTVSIVRPANVYGPGQPFKPGFGVIRTMLEHLLRGTVMEIWGGGDTVRDYLYIDDMVDALIRLIELPEDHSTYNIGSGIGLSLNEVARVIEEVSGRRLATRHRQKRRSDVNGIVLDSSRFCTRTLWQPKVSIEGGILATWQWLSARQTPR